MVRRASSFVYVHFVSPYALEYTTSPRRPSVTMSPFLRARAEWDIYLGMTGYEYIVESIALFEGSLASRDCSGPIKTVAELARRVGYSVYHFTRLFYAIAGENPKEYMVGRILSESARVIAETDLSLAEIAERAGFPDYETFSRAFKKRFGVTPSKVRDARALPSGMVTRLAPLPPDPRAHRKTDAIQTDATQNVVVAEPTVVAEDGFCLTGLSFFIDGGTVSFHKQWATFMKAQGAVRARVMPETYCQFSSWTEDDSVDGMSVLCALETDPAAAQEPIFATRSVPAASYLRFLHVGDISSIAYTYRYVYQVWFATHDVRPLDLWEFQRYRGGVTEIYIPIALR